MFRALIACLTGALCFAQTGQLDASSALFSVMAALNAAGYDQDAESANNHPLRKAVTDHLKSKNLASVA